MSVYLDTKSLYPHLKVNWNVLMCKICIARRLVVDIFPWCNANFVPFPSGTLVARRMGNGSIMTVYVPTHFLSLPLYRYFGTGLIAMHGFRNSSRTPCHLVVFSEEVFALLWLELHSISWFHRVGELLWPLGHFIFVLICIVFMDFILWKLLRFYFVNFKWSGIICILQECKFWWFLVTIVIQIYHKIYYQKKNQFLR